MAALHSVASLRPTDSGFFRWFGTRAAAYCLAAMAAAAAFAASEVMYSIWNPMEATGEAPVTKARGGAIPDYPEDAVPATTGGFIAWREKARSQAGNVGTGALVGGVGGAVLGVNGPSVSLSELLGAPVKKGGITIGKVADVKLDTAGQATQLVFRTNDLQRLLVSVPFDSVDLVDTAPAVSPFSTAGSSDKFVIDLAPQKTRSHD